MLMARIIVSPTIVRICCSVVVIITFPYEPWKFIKRYSVVFNAMIWNIFSVSVIHFHTISFYFIVY